MLTNADRKKRVDHVGVPDCDSNWCPKLDPVIQAIVPNEASKADGYLLRLQQFWLDATAPLTAIIETAEEGKLTPELAMLAAQTALVLMGNAHQYMAQERRKQLLMNLNPALKSMANDEKSFKNAAPMLFGDEFAKLATERVDQLKAISKFSKPEQKKSNRFFGYPPKLFQGRLWGWEQKRLRMVPPLFEEQQLQTKPKQPRTETVKKFSHLNCMPIDIHIESYRTGFRTSALNMILPSIERGLVATVHAGRIRWFIHNWRLITQDQWVLEMVQGFRLPLLQTPVQSKPLPEIHLAADQTALIMTEVEELIRKGAISPALQAPGGFVSELFLVPKKDGGFRPVINLKALNMFIQEKHFKMENFHLIKELVRPQEWLVKVDLKDAYFLVPVHPDHHRFLQFQRLGQTYQFCCLPFGLSCASRVFTKLMKPVVSFLRERGMRLIIYLDDILVISSSQEEAREYVLLIRDLFSSLGLIINEKKSQLVPSQEVVFLGYLISTVTINISLPSEKMRKIQQEATDLLKAASVSIWQIAAFIGMTNAAKQAIPMASMYHRQLQALINRVIPLAGSEIQAMRQSYHNQVELTVEAREELTWWSQAARNHNTAPIIIPPPDLVIETDTSLVGWGARCLDQGQEVFGQ